MSAKATHIFFSKNISIYAIFNDQSFNDTLTNDIVSFEQLGPEIISVYFTYTFSLFYTYDLVVFGGFFMRHPL